MRNKMPRVKYMNKRQRAKYNLSQYPNFFSDGNVRWMKHYEYGEDALLVQSGACIYNVPKEIYDVAK